MNSLMYLAGDIDAAVESILADDKLANTGLTKNKVMRTIKSFQGDILASSSFLRKYAVRDDQGIITELTLSESKARWARAMVEVDAGFPGGGMVEEYFMDLYEYFLPGGRQMFALGNDCMKKATLSNCYFIGIEEDSIEGIFDAAKKMARTYSYGGGVGTCIGPLRPKDSKVSNTARYSTGAVSFMDLYALVTYLIGQQGRRGALLMSIPVYHPDILDFIDIKHNSTAAIKEANISIKLTNKFMKAVVSDTDFELFFETAHERISKIIRARVIWEKMIKSAHRAVSEEGGGGGEPGALFWDTAVERSPSDRYPRLCIQGTNPCLTKDTWIHTNKGPEKIENLIGTPFIARVNGSDYPSTDNGFFKTGLKDVYLLSTKEGYSIKATVDHNMLVMSKYTPKKDYVGWRELGDVRPGDKVVMSNHRASPFWEGLYSFDEGYMLGLLVGDGCLMPKNGVLNVWEKDIGGQGIMEAAEESVGAFRTRVDFGGWRQNRDRFVMVFSALRDAAMNLGMRRNDKCITPTLEKCSSDFYRGFLRGFFDTDGSVQGTQEKGISVRLTQSDIDRLLAVQRMLLRLGIFSTIYKNRKPAGNTLLPDGRGGHKLYPTKALHELVIANNNIDEFNRLIGFSHIEKKNRLELLLSSYHRAMNRERFIAEVESIEFIGKEEVFDATINDIHMFDANGFSVHNCGEIFLEKSGACVLGSLLLHRFVKDPFTLKAQFDWELFKDMICRGVRHLDNVVELNINRHPVEEQRETARAGRRIGLGITGLGDMLSCLMLKYDSDESVNFINRLFSFKSSVEYSSSMDLSKQRGPFPLFDPDIHYTTGFCADLPEELKKKGKELGQRNVSISTIAPNGTLSIVAQCTSGIEPMFEERYDRYVELTGRRERFEVVHPGVVRCLKKTGLDSMPDFFRSAYEVDPMYRIKIQSAAQKYVDASISSTINLPKEATEETVSNIYIEAWKQGLKGVTVYREGSREGILVSSHKADNPLRGGPGKMDTIAFKFLAENNNKYHVLVSYREKDITKPYQVFVLNYTAGESDSFVKIGNALVKLLEEKGADQKRIDKHLERSTCSLHKMARFISLSMKLGYIKECYDILDEYAYAGSLAAKLCNILSLSFNAGAKLCPSCGSPNVKFTEGCLICKDCGNDKCGG